MPIEEVKDLLSEIKGHLVEMPLQFLIEEKQLVTYANLGEVNSITLVSSSCFFGPLRPLSRADRAVPLSLAYLSLKVPLNIC